MSTHVVPVTVGVRVYEAAKQLIRVPEGISFIDSDCTLTFTPDLTAPQLVTFAAIEYDARAPERLAAFAPHLNPDGTIADPAVIPPPLPALVPKLAADGTVLPAALPAPLAAIIPKLNPDGSIADPAILPTPLVALLPKLNPDGTIADPAVIAPVLPAIVPLVIPPGVIVMWAGSVASIPAGWKLCDGTLGTPDLRSRFIKGAAANPGGTGGSSTHTHAAHTGVISHVHPLISKTVATGTQTTYEMGTADVSSTGGTENVFTAAPAGAVASLAHDTSNSEPPWFALCFLMKT